MRYQEIVARVFVIETEIKSINNGIAKLGGKREYSYGPVAVLEDYRFHICQERIALEKSLVTA